MVCRPAGKRASVAAVLCRPLRVCGTESWHRTQQATARYTGRLAQVFQDRSLRSETRRAGSSDTPAAGVHSRRLSTAAVRVLGWQIRSCCRAGTLVVICEVGRVEVLW